MSSRRALTCALPAILLAVQAIAIAGSQRPGDSGGRPAGPDRLPQPAVPRPGDVTGPPLDPAASSAGIWIGPQEIASRPMTGPAWDALVARANADPGAANVADQNSHHDTATLAAALVAARTGAPEYYAKATRGILSAIGTETNPGMRWLAAGRNVLAYVVAADILNLRSDGNPTSDGTRVEIWIRGWLTRELPDNTQQVLRPIRPFGGGSNADAQEGAVYAAVAAYLRDRAALDRAWDAFRTFVCDPAAPNPQGVDLRTGVEYGWAHDDAHPCAVNPKGTTKRVPDHRPGAGQVHLIDGALINDMRRGGPFEWPPAFTQYPWTGLAGLVPAAVILHRAGYPAFAVADRAVLRAVTYLWSLRTDTGQAEWFDGKRGSELVQLVNHYYGLDYPAQTPVSEGHTVAYTDWTHPAAAR